jgi:hypothetical protein
MVSPLLALAGVVFIVWLAWWISGHTARFRRYEVEDALDPQGTLEGDWGWWAREIATRHVVLEAVARRIVDRWKQSDQGSRSNESGTSTSAERPPADAQPGPESATPADAQLASARNRETVEQTVKAVLENREERSVSEIARNRARVIWRPQTCSWRKLKGCSRIVH